MFRKFFYLLLLIGSVFLNAVAAQDCKPPEIVANAGAVNIFSPEQEIVLGELVLESLSEEFRIVHDDKLQAFIDRLGASLERHLPPTGIKHTFYIIDYPEANAFNIAGGHVFVSRKLIAFAANEDELAGVIAHELGHATVRHASIDMTDRLKRVLNVTSLGDRRDISDKFNRLIENARTKRSPSRDGHENEQQMEADKIGLFAMTAAGYDPEAFTTFFDRLTESDGKTGSWFGDLFGTTRPEQKRLREMTRLTNQLPAACRERVPDGANQEFLNWQANVVISRGAEVAERLPGLIWKKELAPKLRGDISRLLFSPNGEYLVAQDDYSLTVMKRDPLKVLFQIPAENVTDVSFSSGAGQLVFTADGRHFERWDIASQKPLEARELFLQRNCVENRLSPDGKYLVCIDSAANLALVETATGRKVFEKKKFYVFTELEKGLWAFIASDAGVETTGFFQIEFSPESKFLLVSRSDRFRVNFGPAVFTPGLNTDDAAFALDLTSLTPIKVDADLKNISSHAFVFLEGGKIVGMPGWKRDEAGVFQFPNGKRLEKFFFAARSVKRTENPNYVVVKPTDNAKMGIFDLKKGMIVTGFNKADAALWENFVAFEAANGRVVIQKFKYNESEKRFDATDVASVEIPVSALSRVNSATVSDNFNWMMLSSNSRGGLWNLQSGDRKLYVRNFDSSLVTDSGTAIADFPKLDDVKRSLFLCNPADGTMAPYGEMDRKAFVRQHGRFVLTRKPLDEKNIDDRRNFPNFPGPIVPGMAFEARESEEGRLNRTTQREARLEVLDLMQNKIVWSRDFPKNVPRFSFDSYSGRLTFFWSFLDDSTTDKLKEFPALESKVGTLGNKSRDNLIEVVDVFKHKTIGAFLLESGKGSFAVLNGQSERDWSLLNDTNGRVLAYSISTGELRHRFFGSFAVLNPVSNIVAVENFPGEISLYSLDTGERAARLEINGNLVFARFSLDGSRLFVLSDRQSAYAFDVSKMLGTKK